MPSEAAPQNCVYAVNVQLSCPIIQAAFSVSLRASAAVDQEVLRICFSAHVRMEALLPAVIPSNLQCLLATEKKRVASSVHRERPTSVVAFRGGRIRVPATAAALRSPTNVPTGETHLPAALQLAAWSKRFLPSLGTARGGSSYPGF